MTHYDTVVHLIAGGLGGTAGAIITCPLEVVKTRLQSSVATFHIVNLPPSVHSTISASESAQPSSATSQGSQTPLVKQCKSEVPSQPSVKNGINQSQSMGIWKYAKHIVETEGPRALFKGLVPNLVGVAPSRAVYFCTYSQTKNYCNRKMTPDTPLVHIYSAACAGFTSCTLTNPIWFVKTRLQLDQSKYGTISTLHCIKNIYKTSGFTGFYKGITASYYGISETIIHFVLYEFIKAKLHEMNQKKSFDEQKSARHFMEFMFAGAVSKTCASCIAYPHEVARTRLRQEGDKYKSFFQTLILVFKEEGYRGIYRGIGTQLIRQIPNTAIMMTTYEAVIHLFNCAYTAPDIHIYAEDEKF